MNKNAIQKYAIWARNELRNQITQNAFKYGITPKEKPERGLESVNGIMLSPIERKQRDQLVDQVLLKGFDQVVEELAYTWFNRLIAIRFMEVNDYLPEHIRVLSSSSNEFKPEILTKALNLDEKHFKKDLILRLIDEGKQEELYRYLLLAECNALNEILPVMFEQMDGYTELSLPANLLKSDSVIGKLISDIDEADWKVTGSEDEEGGQVQIIGWLYQYYNSELKDETFADLKKKNKKISKERIPAATQLFTPDWIVRYMVENSLGRLWLEGHPNEELKKNWKYYLDEAEQEPEVESQLKEIREEYASLKPEDLSTADLAMGSGHILVYAFDVLMQIYRSEGYRDRDAVKSILENNLYGLDIDDRAAQLAYFAIMMKAREYDRRIFSRGVKPNVFAIQESDGISEDAVEYFANGDRELKTDIKTLISEMKGAKELGSIIKVSNHNFGKLEERLKAINSIYDPFAIEAIEKLGPIIYSGKLLNKKYQIISMNPPYMGTNNIDKGLQKYIKDNYTSSRADLYSIFIELAIQHLEPLGLLSIITQHSWMFLSSYQLTRELISTNTLENMVHLGPHAFEDISGEVVQTTCFTVRKVRLPEYSTKFVRLVDEKEAQAKKKKYLAQEGRFVSKFSQFKQIPGEPIAYWLSKRIFNIYGESEKVESQYQAKQGMTTSDNNRFLRLWYEVDFSKIGFSFSSIEDATNSEYKWFPYNKGGENRKWYGNNDYIVNFYHGGEEMEAFHAILNQNSSGGRIKNKNLYFKESISWSKVSSTGLAFRFKEPGFIFDVAGSSIFAPTNGELLYLLGLYNSKLGEYLVGQISPTMNFEAEQIKQMPLIMNRTEKVQSIVKELISIAKDDWDYLETGWAFKVDPLVNLARESGHVLKIRDGVISEAQGILHSQNHYVELLEKLNKEFIEIYNLSGEINPKIDKTEVLLPRLFDSVKMVKNLLSYFVGCIFGRFDPNSNGLNFAGGQWQNHENYLVDPDNIVPVGEEYFDDDITSRFTEWVKNMFGSEHLEENLDFIAETLGTKGSSRETIRNYFINDFYNDHLKTYQKRPIYWLFDSGKKNGFKCLIYIHRYQPDTIARIRTDYVHEQQERYRSQIKHINDTIDEAPKSEQVKMRKQLKDLTGKLDEVSKYEEKIHHLADQMIDIDLDDGVKHNYALFQDVLAKIK